MNPKLQKVMRELARTKEKIVELEASLPALEKQKTELENAEVIKAFRSADVAPENFSAFIEAYKAGMGADVSVPVQPAQQKYDTQEELTHDED